MVFIALAQQQALKSRRSYGGFSVYFYLSAALV